jgi:hypothetical protein
MGDRLFIGVRIQSSSFTLSSSYPYSPWLKMGCLQITFPSVTPSCCWSQPSIPWTGHCFRPALLPKPSLAYHRDFPQLHSVFQTTIESNPYCGIS